MPLRRFAEPRCKHAKLFKLQWECVWSHMVIRANCTIFADNAAFNQDNRTKWDGSARVRSSAQAAYIRACARA